MQRQIELNRPLSAVSSQSSVDDHHPTGDNTQTSPANTSRQQDTLLESPFYTENRYSVLANEGETNMEEAATPRVPKPPPIFVRNIKDFKLLCAQLDQKVGREHYLCVSRQLETKISCDTPETYRKVIRYLKDTQAQYHTYLLKEERLLRVVIRNLHHTTPTECIIEELSELGFTPKSVLNVHGSRRTPEGVTKVPLPLFFVDLERTPNVSDVYSITSLYHTKVTVEKPHPRRDMIQCHRCQEYGHAKGSCNYRPRCVKCGENHDSRECQKTRDTPAVCALCGKDHPANYKGCDTYQQLKRRTQRDSSATSRRGASATRQRGTLRQRDSSTHSQRGHQAQAQARRAPSRPVQDGLSYSRAVSPGHLEDTTQPQPQRVPEEQPPRRQRREPITQISQPSTSLDMYSLMDSFLTKTQEMIKSMIDPLLKLITALIARLPVP